MTGTSVEGPTGITADRDGPAQLGPGSQAVTCIAISSATCIVVAEPPRSGVRRQMGAPSSYFAFTS